MPKIIIMNSDDQHRRRAKSVIRPKGEQAASRTCNRQIFENWRRRVGNATNMQRDRGVTCGIGRVSPMHKLHVGNQSGPNPDRQLRPGVPPSSLEPDNVTGELR